MSNFKAGDKVLVYTSGAIAAAAEHGQLVNDGAPRAAKVVRLHQPTTTEPLSYEVAFDDTGESAFITDPLRLRLAPKKK